MSLLFLLFLLLSTQVSFAAAPGTRVWDMVNEDLKTDITILSKVCALGSFIENIDFDGSIIDQVLAKAYTIESIVEVIDPRTITIESVVDIIEDLDRTILSKVCVIESLIENIDFDGSVIDQVLSKVCVIESVVDIIEELDQTILSKVCVIESKIDLADACGSILITIDNPTISVEGSYCLAQNITGTIIITVDNVVIDLNNHVIDGGFNGISIDANLSNITIRNGTINNTTEEGILINQGCSKINLENLLLCNCAIGTDSASIVFSGIGSNQISKCYVSNVRVTNSHGGIYVQNMDGLIIKNSSIIDCEGTDAVAGIILFGDDASTPAKNIVIQDCFISTLTSFVGPNPNNLTAGILGVTTENVTIDGCIVEELNSSGVFTAGFVFISSSCVNISNSSACKLECTSTEGGTGFTFLNTGAILLDNCTTQSVIARSAAGFSLEGCSDVACRNCLVQNMVSNATVTPTFEGAQGFKFNTTMGQTNNGISLENCMVKDLQGGNFGGATGFLLRGDITNIVLQSCSALDISNTNTLTSSTGFAIIDGADITCNHLLAQTIAGDSTNNGFVAQRCTNINCNDIATQNMSGDSNNTGFVILDCTNITCNELLAQTMSGGPGTGLFIGDCQNLALHDILVQGILGTENNGISISTCQNVSVHNALVQALFGQFATGYRFRDLESIVISDCISNNIVSDQAASPLYGFLFQRVTLGATCNCLSNSVQNLVAGGAEGFFITECQDLIFDFCKTSSNYTASSGAANGFSVNDSSNIFFDNCTSSYNVDEAFRITGNSDDCLVGNCTAAYSDTGFADFSSTSTFYNNVAAKNSTANYIGVPFVVAQGTATITGGNASI